MKIIFIVLLVIIFPQEFKTSTFEVESVSLLDSLPANMPLSKKLLWGKNGLIRKFNLAPNSRVEEIKLRSKMLQLHQKLNG